MKRKYRILRIWYYGKLSFCKKVSKKIEIEKITKEYGFLKMTEIVYGVNPNIPSRYRKKILNT